MKIQDGMKSILSSSFQLPINDGNLSFVYPEPAASLLNGAVTPLLTVAFEHEDNFFTEGILHEILNEILKIGNYSLLNIKTKLYILHLLINLASSCSSVRNEIQWRMEQISKIKGQWIPHTWWTTIKSKMPTTSSASSSSLNTNNEYESVISECSYYEKFIKI